ncbi:MAG: hypothetical protein KDJ54_01435 [Candidatus Competibacteraceae bacterium]|nr:hypothetical protein [Candidatus Competibacteraceae bacterium]
MLAWSFARIVPLFINYYHVDYIYFLQQGQATSPSIALKMLAPTCTMSQNGATQHGTDAPF